MADERYDADGDVSRFLLDCTTMDVSSLFSASSQPAAVSAVPVVPVPVEPRSYPVPADHVEVEPPPAQIARVVHYDTPPAADLGQGPHPLHDLDVHQLPETHFQFQQEHYPAPATHLEPHTLAPAIHFQSQPHPLPQPHPLALAPMHLEQHQTLAPAPPAAYGGFVINDQSTTVAAGGGGGGAGASSSVGNLSLDAASPFPYDTELAAIAKSLMEDTCVGGGGGAGGSNAAPFDQYSNFLPFHPGQLDCSNCQLVRQIIHINTSRIIHMLIHSTAPTTFEHAIIDRKYTGANGQVTSQQLLYFDLSKNTEEWASSFITSNIEALRNDTSGQFQDTGYYFGQASNHSNSNAAQMNNNQHRALETNMLLTIMSSTTPPENAPSPAAASALPVVLAPPAAALTPVAVAPPAAASSTLVVAPPAAASSTLVVAPPTAPAPPPAVQSQKQKKQRRPAGLDNDAVVLALEEFAVANNQATQKKEIEILESCHAVELQQHGDPINIADAIMYPSMQAKKLKMQVPRKSRDETMEDLRVAKEEAERELKTVSSFSRRLCRKNKEFRHSVDQINTLNRKIVSMEKKSHSSGPCRLPITLREIDGIKLEKAGLYARIISAVKKDRAKDHEGSSSSSAASF
ncbi:hypothetical protein GUJ93_ZPchr0002g25307 [Zizania palustris]|uniref:Uncharacterized protein n=1 Tax=Zizania palustris TaxID=103762 RepID=A0A8J5SP17_ZIZPA|nr:hypothetical protein GUJ93_ZPchr0002g25307 [Zizania palustris]